MGLNKSNMYIIHPFINLMAYKHIPVMQISDKATKIQYSSDDNFTLAHKQFTHTLKQFTQAHIRVELLMACIYYPQGTHVRLLDDLWEWFLTWLHTLTFGITS